MPTPPKLTVFLSFACLLALVGCQSAYYGTMEKLGVHKRDILVDRVEEAKDAQEDAKESFATVFDEFLAVSGVEVSGLKKRYDKIQSAFDRSERRAEEVWDRIDSIKSVSKALFGEWERELDQYSSAALRSSSETQLDDTKRLYARLMETMESAAGKMDPVLDAFRDQTLFLKHNLNAQAIAALDRTAVGLQDDVRELIAQMEASIDEANAFISQMRSANG